MVCNKYLIRLKVKNQLSEIFIGILQEISELGLCSEKDELMIQQNNGLMNGDQFLNDLYMIVKRYVPAKNENLLIKAIGLLPRAIKNVQHIKQNSGIIVLQDKILDKYFNSMSDENIKKNRKNFTYIRGIIYFRKFRSLYLLFNYSENSDIEKSILLFI